MSLFFNAGKCDYQQNLEDILDAAMVSTPEGVTGNNTNVLMKSTPVKKQGFVGSHTYLH